MGVPGGYANRMLEVSSRLLLGLDGHLRYRVSLEYLLGKHEKVVLEMR